MYEQEVLSLARATACIVPSAGRRRILLAAALPLALGACGLLGDAATPDDSATAAVPLDSPADLARAADSSIATMGWLPAVAPEAGVASAMPVAYLSSAPERLPREMQQLAALSDTDLEGLRGGFSLPNGVTVNFAASIRSIARRIVDGTPTPVFDVQTSFSFDGGPGGATVATAVDGGVPVVTTGVDPAVGIQSVAGDPAGTLAIHNVSTSEFNTLVQNVVDNTDATSVATLDFFLGGTIGAFTSQAASTQTSINTLVSNSLVNSLP